MKALLPLAALALSATAPAPVERDKTAILAVIGQMETAWNRGDFRGYMAGFENSGVVFVSGGKFQDGWQGTLDHYIRDYGGSAARRGHLHFYDMTVDLLAPDAAMLVGRYRLDRGARHTEGVNTRLFKKIHGKWRITLNHVSAYDVTPSAPASPPSPPSN